MPRKSPSTSLRAADPHEWIQAEGITDSGKVDLPKLLIDEVIGQDEAVEVAKKAARQGRHLLLLGDPGTGKSMIAKAMTQILPESRLDDVLVHPNPKDGNQPVVQTVKGGKGRDQMQELGKDARKKQRLFTIFEWALAGLLVAGGISALLFYGGVNGMIVAVLTLMVAIFFLFVSRQTKFKADQAIPNLLIERPAKKVSAPYVDATGSHAGALLGDVRHDPFQSGGLETPVHLRVEPGAIHKAHKGLLFIDEINVLRLDSQQALLTAMQDKRYAITGQSDKSSGAMVRTAPVPCDFILVAAGNMDVIDPRRQNEHVGLHPALRSRIRGYGYEVYVRAVMDDTDANRHKLVRFVAQEVRRDGQIPHFDGAAIAEVIREAQRRSGHSGKLTLRLRELGGLVRTAGDLARDDGRNQVTVDDVLRAKHMSMSLEYQVTRRGIEVATAREALETDGDAIGVCVGTAFMGTGETGEPAGIVVPVEADATISSDRHRGTVFLGGGLEKDHTVKDNVSAMLKRLRGHDMAGIDIHAQALLQAPGADVHGLALASAVSCISALEDVPVRRDTVAIGSLAVGGCLRPVDGITQMIEAAADLGYQRAVVPAASANDILLEHRYRDMIEILLVPDLASALPEVLHAKPTRVKALQTALGRNGHSKR